MPSAMDVLSARVPLCLVQRTSRRTFDVLRELAALSGVVRFVEGRCTQCTTLGPVIARARS